MDSYQSGTPDNGLFRDHVGSISDCVHMVRVVRQHNNARTLQKLRLCHRIAAIDTWLYEWAMEPHYLCVVAQWFPRID